MAGCAFFGWHISITGVLYFRHVRQDFARTWTVSVRSVLERQRSMTGCTWRAWQSSASVSIGSSLISPTNATSATCQSLFTDVLCMWWNITTYFVSKNIYFVKCCLQRFDAVAEWWERHSIYLKDFLVSLVCPACWVFQVAVLLHLIILWLLTLDILIPTTVRTSSLSRTKLY